MAELKKNSRVKITDNRPLWHNKEGIVISSITDLTDLDQYVKVKVNLGDNKNVIQTFLLQDLLLIEDNKDFKSEYLNEDMQNTNQKDSLGNILSPEQINYFKDSKVRDNTGNLLVCYHGSSAEFDTFDINKIKGGNSLGKGFYFSSDFNTSAQYSKIQNVKQVYLNIKNPKYFVIDNAHQNFLIKQALEYNILKQDLDGNIVNLNTKVSDVLQAHGYDGVIAYIPRSDKYEIVVYNSNQIKSITNKNPTQSNNMNENLNIDTAKDIIAPYLIASDFDEQKQSWYFFDRILCAEQLEEGELISIAKKFKYPIYEIKTYSKKIKIIASKNITSDIIVDEYARFLLGFKSIKRI